MVYVHTLLSNYTYFGLLRFVQKYLHVEDVSTMPL
jgi:hypothetical protein